MISSSFRMIGHGRAYSGLAKFVIPKYRGAVSSSSSFSTISSTPEDGPVPSPLATESTDSTTTTTTRLSSSNSTVPFSSRISQSLNDFTREGVEPQSVDIKTLLPPNYTPGHVLAVLNQVGKGGYRLGGTISTEHFRVLLESVRPYEPRDAKIIITALVNYKRINRFPLTPELASECIQAILFSDPKMGGVLILEHFTIESGLYFAATTHDMNIALENVLQEGLDVIPTEEDFQKYQVSGDIQYNPQHARIWKALLQFMSHMILRIQRPYQEMKKRARRAYLAQCKTHEGPNAKTMELVVEIGLAVADAESVYQDLVLQPYRSWNPTLKPLEVTPHELLVSLNSQRLLQSLHEETKEQDIATKSDDDELDNTTSETSNQGTLISS